MAQYYGGGAFRDLFSSLEYYGFVDVIMPFLLIFTIVYAVLDKVKVFKEKKYNVIISTAITLLAIMPHVLYPGADDIVSILNSTLPQFAMVTIAIVLFMIMSGLLGAKEGKFFSIAAWLAPWLAFAIIGIIILRSAYPSTAFSTDFFSFLGDPRMYSLIIIVLVAGFVIRMIVGGGSSGTPTTGEKVKDFLGKLFEEK